MLNCLRPAYNLPILVILLCTIGARAQGVSTTQSSQPFHGALKGYDEAIENQLLIYNGIRYTPFKKPYDGSPYFRGEQWESGSLIYDDQRFENISMMYDNYLDKLIIEHYDRLKGAAHIELRSYHVKKFELRNAVFIYLAPDSVAGDALAAGFYEIMYDGKVKYIVKRSKKLKEDINSNKLHLEFQPLNRYYIVMNDHYHLIRNKRTMKKAFGEDKKTISRFIKSNRLKFNKRKIETSILRTIQYYDQTR